MKSRIVFAHALSPLHAGTGQGVGVIDLPVAREKATGLPFLPGSSLKGVLRDACEEDVLRAKVFGFTEYASSAAFSDLRLLALPVRSIRGTFAWVSSRYVLLRLVRDLDCAGIEGPQAAVPALKGNSCAVPEKNSALTQNARVILEDLDLAAKEDRDTGIWARWIAKQVFPEDKDWRALFLERFCMVSDDVLGFLLDTATEVFARIRLESGSKTVVQGGLWYEEALPAETILAGLVAASHVRATPEKVFETLKTLTEKPIQLGGKASVGRGLCRILLVGGN